VYDAIVLAGGTAHRLGGVAKPQLTVGGQTLLDRALAAVPDARRPVVVGPEQPTARPVTWCREQPPGGGPVAAIAVGLPHTSAEVVIVLAADLPWIAAAVPDLLAALPGRGAALLVDASGRANYLAAAWRRLDLVAAVSALGEPAGVAARRLTAGFEPVLVPDRDGWGQDCDTWADLAAARTRRRDG
jgi:molybdopterin-guanine dinucleotide biosynthesis protein A